MELVKAIKKNLNYNAINVINRSLLLTLINVENGIITYKTLEGEIRYIKEEIQGNKKIVSIYK